MFTQIVRCASKLVLFLLTAYRSIFLLCSTKYMISTIIVLLRVTVPLFGQTLIHVEETDSVVTSLAVSPQRNLIAIGCEDGSIMLQSTPRFETICNLRSRDKSSWPEICNLQFSSNGLAMLSEGIKIPSGPIHIWKLPSEKGIHVSRIILDEYSGGAISPDGKDCTAIFNSDTFQCRVIDIHTHSIRTTLPMPVDAPYLVINTSYSPNGRLIAGAARNTENNDWSIIIWDTKSYKIQRVIIAAKRLKKGLGVPGYPKVFFSHAGKYIASIHASGKIMVWETSTGNPVISVNHAIIASISYDEKYLATSRGQSNEVSLWDVNKSTIISSITPKQVGEVKCLKFLPIPNTLMVAGANISFKERLPFLGIPVEKREKESHGSIVVLSIDGKEKQQPANDEEDDKGTGS